MAVGSDARVGIAKETTYGTRVAPTRFLPLTAEDLGFTVNRYRSPAIGTGMWGAPSVVTTKVGSGSLSGDVPTVGFSFLVDGLHGNTVTPAQQASTTAYLHTHTLNSPPSKSYSIQVQTPPVSSATLVPHDMSGVMWGGLTLSWTAAGVLSFSLPAVYQNLDTTQSLATYTAPTSYSLFGFQGGSLSFGGTAETNIIGDGSLTIAYPLRDDAFKLGSNGLIAKPVLTDKPTATLSTTADFEDNTDLLRGLNNTSGDVVLKFQFPTAIASTYFPYVQVTLPDCVVTANRATVSGPGPLSQPVEFSAASAGANPPVIAIMSTEVTV